MADLKLSDCETCKFIELIRDHPCIWDTRCPDYSNRDRAREARIAICREMGSSNMNEETLMRKYKSLRTQYGKCLTSYLASMKSGASTNDIKEPTWKFFQLMDFLRPCIITRKGKNNMESEDRNLPFTETQYDSQQGGDSQMPSQPEENDDVEVLLNQVRTSQPVMRTLTSSPVPVRSQSPSQQHWPPSPSQELLSPSSDLVSSITPAPSPYTKIHETPPSKKRKVTQPAEQAVAILQTLVEQKKKPPPPANETANDLFFRMIAKKVEKLPEQKLDKLRMEVYSMVCKALYESDSD